MKSLYFPVLKKTDVLFVIVVKIDTFNGIFNLVKFLFN